MSYFLSLAMYCIMSCLNSLMSERSQLKREIETTPARLRVDQDIGSSIRRLYI